MTEAFPLAISPREFNDLFGRDVDVAHDLLIGLDYREATPAEVVEIHSRLSDILGDSRVGSSALDRWEQGWAEVRARVARDGVSEETLAPQYFRHRMLRMQGRLICARSATFEPNLYKAIKSVVFDRYLADVSRVVEFGCGTGSNLYQLHRAFPRQQLVGCDWARQSQELIALIARATGADLTAAYFDMRTLEGREAISVDSGTAVLTLHAMEQLGRDADLFVDYLIASKPKIAVHLEPIVELYDPEVPFDADAIAYHRKRGYLEGFLPALSGRSDVEIVETRRLGFGSTFHEAYTLIVWKPR